MAHRHSEAFKFLDTGKLIHGSLRLTLVEEVPGNPVGDTPPTYRFRMALASQGCAIGHIELRIADTSNRNIVYEGNIGYGVLPEHRGQRYAARGCALLLPLARRHGVREVWITCNPDNCASRRTA